MNKKKTYVTQSCHNVNQQKVYLLMQSMTCSWAMGSVWPVVEIFTITLITVINCDQPRAKFFFVIVEVLVFLFMNADSQPLSASSDMVVQGCHCDGVCMQHCKLGLRSCIVSCVCVCVTMKKKC